MTRAVFLDRARRILFEASFYIVIIAGSYITLFSLGPWIETRFFPPVGKLHILSIASTDMKQSTITAEFTKIRNCEYIGLSWFRGKPDGEFERVPVILLRQPGDDSSPNRPVGTQRAGPWIISVPPDEIAGNSFARLTHRCHPLWVTTTDFFP